MVVLKMRLIYIILIAAICISLPLTSAFLGVFKQNDCVNIVVPLNATTVILTNVNTPSPNSTIIISNKTMTSGVNLFNYTFCNTSTLGTYTYGYCDNNGNCYGNDFLINGSGQDVTQSQVILIIIGLVVLFIFAMFFFILSFLFQHPGTKIFFMALSSLTLIILIGIVTSNATVYLAEFPTLNSFYNNYYILMTILAGGAMMGLIVWLIYYSVTLFNKTRTGNHYDD